MQPGERLKRLWAKEGVREGASPDALDALERKLRLILPTEFRGYLSIVDGMMGGAWVGNEIEFWPVARILDEAGAWGCFEPGINGTLLPFADFLINSHAYAIRVSSNDAPVFIVHGRGVQIPCAPSFDEFIARYEQDHPSLYGLSDS